MKERYEELVNTNNSLPEAPSSSSIQAIDQLPAIKSWREREGVEPTAPTEGPGPTDLKFDRGVYYSVPPNSPEYPPVAVNRNLSPILSRPVPRCSIAFGGEMGAILGEPPTFV